MRFLDISGVYEEETHQFTLDRLVDHKMYHGLGNSNVTCSDTFIEAPEATCPVNSLYTITYRHLLFRVVI